MLQGVQFSSTLLLAPPSTPSQSPQHLLLGTSLWYCSTSHLKLTFFLWCNLKSGSSGPKLVWPKFTVQVLHLPFHCPYKLLKGAKQYPIKPYIRFTSICSFNNKQAISMLVTGAKKQGRKYSLKDLVVFHLCSLTPLFAFSMKSCSVATSVNSRHPCTTL